MNVGDTLKQPFTRSVEFIEECWAELKKVHFPNRKETQAATIVVIIGVVVVAVYLGVIDYLLSSIVTRVLG
jgi:preprotein translocase subunit SecE